MDKTDSWGVHQLLLTDKSQIVQTKLQYVFYKWSINILLGILFDNVCYNYYIFYLKSIKHVTKRVNCRSG